MMLVRGEAIAIDWDLWMSKAREMAGRRERGKEGSMRTLNDKQTTGIATEEQTLYQPHSQPHDQWGTVSLSHRISAEINVAEWGLHRHSLPPVSPADPWSPAQQGKKKSGKNTSRLCLGAPNVRRPPQRTNNDLFDSRFQTTKQFGPPTGSTGPR